MNKEAKLGPEENLDLIRWLIDRHDNLRGALANRAAIVLSADALLLTASTFLLDNILRIRQPSSGQEWFIAMALMVVIVLLLISLLSTTNVLVSVWKTSKKIMAADKPSDRVFFNANDTLKKYDKFVSFQEDFLSANVEQLTDYALSELWTAQTLYRLRYRNLRIAIRLLLVALVPFFVAIVASLFWIP